MAQDSCIFLVFQAIKIHEHFSMQNTLSKAKCFSKLKRLGDLVVGEEGESWTLLDEQGPTCSSLLLGHRARVPKPQATNWYLSGCSK